MITKDRIYRQFEVKTDKDSLTVEGYAVVFNDTTVMYEIAQRQYKEEIAQGVFDNTEMQNVVMNFNHTGKPVARTKNGTLELIVDDVGLKVRAELGGTEEGRKLFEEIRGGYIDKMSFAFVISEEKYNKDTRTRTITGIKRLFDVAAVDFPAYDTTSLQARSFFKVEAKKELAEARERHIKQLELKILLGGRR